MNEGSKDGDYPLMHAYLASLPNGLDSHPECQSKASLLHSALLGHPASGLRHLPDVLRERIESPPPAGLWIPAVHLIATVHAIIDVHYHSDEEILAWGARRTAAVSQNPLYRALLRVSGPRVFFTMTAKINRLFQRGTKFEMKKLEAGRALARLRYPRNLHGRESLLGTVAMCETVVQQTGGVSKGTEMVEITPTHALFDCRWELA